MRNLRQIMFPQYRDAKWVELNLNEKAKEIRQSDVSNNPFLQPGYFTDFNKNLLRESGADYSYGGFLEDRSVIWRGSYLPSDGMIHLGVDYWVPQDTAVNMPWDGETVHAIHDKDQQGGWGGRVTFYNRKGDFYFILGHLDPTTALHTPGVNLARGVTTGFLGGRKVNGGWAPHLHLQVMSAAEFKKFDDPMTIDGYGKMSDDIRERYFNPESLV